MPVWLIVFATQSSAACCDSTGNPAAPKAEPVPLSRHIDTSHIRPLKYIKAFLLSVMFPGEYFI